MREFFALETLLNGSDFTTPSSRRWRKNVLLPLRIRFMLAWLRFSSYRPDVNSRASSYTISSTARSCELR